MRFWLFFLFVIVASNIYSSPFERPYVGIKGSYGYFTSTQDYQAGTTYYNYKLGNDRFSYGVIAGLGKQFNNRFFLGLQAGSTFQNKWIGQERLYDETLISGGNTYNAKEPRAYKLNQKTECDLLLQMGYVLNPCNLIYAFLGPSISYFKAYILQSYRDGGPPYNVYYAPNNQSTWKWGLKFGIGLAHALQEHLIVRVETSYSFYDKWKEKTFYVQQIATSYNAVLDPKVMDVSVCLSYGF